MRIRCEQVPELLAHPVESFTEEDGRSWHELYELFYHSHICSKCRELQYPWEGNRQFVFGSEGVKRRRLATEEELRRYDEIALTPQYAPIHPKYPPMHLLSPW